MTPNERLLWASVQRRAATLRPEVAARVLRAFATIRDGMTDAQIARAVQLGGVDRLFEEVLTQALMDVAMHPVREELRRGVRDSFRFAAKAMPAPPKAASTLTVAFDVLNPQIVTAIRTMETRMIGGLEASIRDTVRAYVENGLRDGLNPRAIAVDLRQILGLAPNQEAAVANFRRLLEAGDREALRKALRDKRFDATLERALGKHGTGLTREQIDRMAAAQRRKMIAFNANTQARAAVLEAEKLGQRLSWGDADAKGIVDGDRLLRKWVGVMDARERPEHVAMEGQTVRWDQPYSTGQRSAGEGDWSCRCIDVFFLARA